MAMIFPLLLILLSIFILGNNYVKTGEILEKSIDFTGGTQVAIELYEKIDVEKIEKGFFDQIGGEINTRITSEDSPTLFIETNQEINKEIIISILDQLNIQYKNISIQTIGAMIGESFWKQAQMAIILAFLAIGFVVFITFKSVAPSLAIMIAGGSDFLFAMAGMSVLGIKLSMATLAGLLILIGYSVDTDILLSTRLLKRRSEGNIDERITSSMKTGVTMTTTSIIAFTVLYIISSSMVLEQIALVIILGLISDLPFTWIQNVGIHKWYLEREK